MSGKDCMLYFLREEISIEKTMAINITGKNFELTEAIKLYVEKKTEPFFRHHKKMTSIDVEVDKNTHHKKGEIYHVRMNIQVPQHLIHVEATETDLYAAIDICSSDADRQLKKQKDKYMAQRREAQKTTRNLKSILTFWKE